MESCITLHLLDRYLKNFAYMIYNSRIHIEAGDKERQIRYNIFLNFKIHVLFTELIMLHQYSSADPEGGGGGKPPPPPARYLTEVRSCVEAWLVGQEVQQLFYLFIIIFICIIQTYYMYTYFQVQCKYGTVILSLYFDYPKQLLRLYRKNAPKCPQICPKMNFLIYTKGIIFLNCQIISHRYLAKIFQNSA